MLVWGQVSYWTANAFPINLQLPAGMLLTTEPLGKAEPCLCLD